MKRNVASIYVHWPFCTKLCNYCNFNKYVNTNSELPNQLVKCLKIEGKSILKNANIDRISTIYFGGGTPSLIDPEKIEEIIDEYLGVTSQESTEEITLEINPSREMNREKMQQFIDAGITRFSIGLQSIDDKVLNWMNRDHNGALAEKVINATRDLSGLHSSSIDLIFARPEQSIENWKEELQRIFQKFPWIPHVSLYELTVEKGTKLWKDVKSGLINLPNEDEKAELYSVTIEELAKHGCHRYEISNFAQSEEHQGKHNSNYWLGGNYLGIGPGAHGRYYINGSRYATVQVPVPQAWIQAVENQGHATRKSVLQSQEEILSEYISTSIRTIWGIRKENLPTQILQKIQNDEFCQNFIKDKLLVEDDDVIKLSDQGLHMADFITSFILASISK